MFPPKHFLSLLSQVSLSARQTAQIALSGCLIALLALAASPGSASFRSTAVRAAAAPAAAVMAPGPITALAVSGNDLYVGGSFTSIGNFNANNIAKFNLTTGAWSTLGSGAGATGNGLDGQVEAIAISGNDVYLGGSFTKAYSSGTETSANNVVRWNAQTNSWTALGAGAGVDKNGVNGKVADIVIAGGVVYVGGEFRNAYNSASASLSANGVARWNGSAWSALGAGSGATGNGVWSPGDLVVYALAADSTHLYVGGTFTKVYNSASSEVIANCIARWNLSTNTWAALGTGATLDGNGTTGDVYALEASSSGLYVGGSFTRVFNAIGQSVGAGHIARWTGSAWERVGPGETSNTNGVNGNITQIAVSGANVYVSGDFDTARNASSTTISANCVARFNGTAWTALGTGTGQTGNGVNDPAESMVSAGNDVYLGGDFTAAYNNASSAVQVERIVRWNGSTWTALGRTANAVSSVSAASFSVAEVAQESIIAAFGTNLAPSLQKAGPQPLPTTLNGTTVKVRDSAGTERLAPLFFVSPGQVNYLMPSGTPAGAATVTITNSSGGVATGTIQAAVVAPGVFTASSNGQGVPAAVLLRVKADGAQVYESVARLDNGKWVALPLDFVTSTDQLFLILFGTGIRQRSSLSNVKVTMGGADARVSFAGAVAGFQGLDQVNAQIPRSLIGRGELDVVLTVDNKAANTVRINIK